MIPFGDDYDLTQERLIIQRAQAGSREAAGELVEMHQRFIYNLSLKLINDIDDAKDLTQEILIRMLTKIGQFQFKSSFRGWLYRIVVNHFLGIKRGKAEITARSFDDLGDVLDKLYDEENMSPEEQQKYSDQIVTFRNKCTASLLLCLDRQQRVVFVLGAIFNLKSPVAAKLLDITPENFRKQLSRAKADLFQFMDDKCGLINQNNPCRCHKKTKGFIRDGIIDAETRKFHTDTIQAISAMAPLKNKQMDNLIGGRYLPFFTGHPYENMDKGDELVNALLADPDVKSLFLLD